MYYIYKLYFDNPKHCYIGQTNNLIRRYNTHLRNTAKSNPHKINWINKHKALGQTLNFSILAVVKSKDQIDLIEEQMINYYSKQPGFKLYNKAKGGSSNRLHKEYLLLDPNGIQHTTTDIETFCLDNDLDCSAVYKVFTGKQSGTKGWKVLSIDGVVYKPKSVRTVKTYYLLDSTNNIIEVQSLYRFCKDNNLHYGAMKNLVNGKQHYKSFKGYKLYAI